MSGGWGNLFKDKYEEVHDESIGQMIMVDKSATRALGTATSTPAYQHEMSNHGDQSPPRFPPSLVGAYFHNHCERYAVLKLLRNRGDAMPTSAYQDAVFSRGNKFELGHAETLQQQASDSGGSTHFVNLEGVESLETLRRLRKVAHEVAAGYIEVAHIFHAKFAPPPAHAAVLSNLEVDFLRIERTNGATAASITVVDTKASSHMKLSHQMQIAVYARALSLLLEDDDLVYVAPHGEVAHLVMTTTTTVRFALAPLDGLLDEMLDRTAPKLQLVATKARSSGRDRAANLDVDAAGWRLTPSTCSSCEFRHGCQSAARGTLNEVPYLSHGSFRRMQRANGGSIQVMGDIEDLAARAGLADRHVRVVANSVGAVRASAAQLKPGAHAALAPEAAFTVALASFGCPYTGLSFAFAIVVESTSGIGAAVESESELDAGDARLAATLSTSWVSAVDPPDVKANPMVKRLAVVIDQLRDTGKTVQFLVGSTSDAMRLETALLDAATHGDAESMQAARTCLHQLTDGIACLNEDIAAHVPQPDRFGAFVDTVDKLRRPALERRLLAYQEPTGGSMHDLKEKLKQAMVRDSEKRPHSPPHRFVAVLAMVRDVLMLPVPGFYSLRDCEEHLLSRSAVDDATRRLQTLDVRTEQPPVALVADASLVAPTDDEAAAAFESWQSRRGDLCSKRAVRCCWLLLQLVDEVHKRLRTSSAPKYLLRPWPIGPPVPELALRDPLLQRLAFAKHVEASLSWLQLQRARVRYAANPEEEDDLGSSALRLECISLGEFVHFKSKTGGDAAWQPNPVFRVVSGAERARRDDMPDMMQWLVHVDDDVGRLACVRFSDALHLRWTRRAVRPLLPPALGLAAVSECERSPEGDVSLTLQLPFVPFRFVIGSQYVLSKRATDFTTGKVTTMLQNTGDEFPALLRNPVCWGRDVPLQHSWRDLRQYVDQWRRTLAERARLSNDEPSRWVGRNLKFNGSQAGVVNQLVPPQASDAESRLVCCWGPPGAGKTHTLALTILEVLHAAHTSGRFGGGFRVLVVAFTKKAISNLLEKIISLARAWRQVSRLIEEATGGSQAGGGADGSEDDGGSGWCSLFGGFSVCMNTELEPPALRTAFCVVGATVYGASDKLPPAGEMYDVIVVDEASQLPVPDFGLAFGRLSPGGRLVCAGDHLQLPPILKHSNYPAGEPPLFGSLLHCLLRDEENRVLPLGGDVHSAMQRAQLTVKLRVNYRMNAALTRFSQRLYGSDYTADTSNVGLQLRREATSGVGGSDLAWAVEAALDPAAPLVLLNVAYAEGSSSEQQVGLEARVVVALANHLHAHGLFNESERGQGVYVVTPHHIQRRAICCALDAGADPERVDTVEKIQGQQADVVIVCYGFADLDRLEGEKDFIFSRARLNVSLTRARRKCVLICTDEVLNPPHSILGNAAVRDGILHLQAWASHCHSSEDGVALRIAH